MCNTVDEVCPHSTLPKSRQLSSNDTQEPERYNVSTVYMTLGKIEIKEEEYNGDYYSNKDTNFKQT